MKNKLLKIINSYGVDHQQRKMAEEFFELQEAISTRKQEKEYSSSTDELENHIAEEIADMLVMMNQFKLYFRISKTQIKNIMEEKVERQIKRMKEEGFDVSDLYPDICDKKEKPISLEDINEKLLNENRRLKEQISVVAKENIELKEKVKLQNKEIMKLIVSNSK